MTKAIILGDVHCGKGLAIGKPGLGTQLNSRIIDQLNILDWVLQQAISNQVEHLILTGDVFEEAKTHPTLVTLFIQWLQICSDAGICVHVIIGNHDIFRSGSFYTSSLDIIATLNIPGVFIYTNIAALELTGLSFIFIPFRDRRSFNTDSNAEAIELLKSQIKYECWGLDNRNYKIAVGHLSLEGSLPGSDEIDDMQNELICPLELFKEFDFTLMGHVHRFQTLSEAPFIGHIGSADISNFGEENQKKFIALIDSGKTPVIDFIQIPNRPLRSLSISIPNNIADTTTFVINWLKSQPLKLNGAIIKLNILLESSDLLNVDKKQIEQCLIELGAFFAPRIDQERKIAQLKKHSGSEQLDNTVNETTAIKTYAEINIETPYQKDFIELANLIVKELNASS